MKTITLRQLRRAARIIYSARARVLVSQPSHSHSGVPPSRFASSYSCRHFHFHFWLSLRQELPSLCPTVDIIFKFPPSPSARLCVFPRSSSPLCSPFFSVSLLFCLHFSSRRAFSFSFSRRDGICALALRHRSFALRFSAGPSSLRRVRGVSSETPTKREREDFLSRPGRSMSSSRSHGTAQKVGARRRNVKFHGFIRSIDISEVAARGRRFH